jgi:hypothetical protein
MQITKYLLCLVYFGLIATVLFAQNEQKYWQQQVNYNINVTLNDVNNTLEGFETINYTNNSADTLSYIWLHIWQNAFKNDKSAYTKQQLENGNTDFYFSNEAQKGYINRLNFKVNGQFCNSSVHVTHQDIIKLQLPSILLPGATIEITTPFLIKISKGWLENGYAAERYKFAQWYPKLAVYDKNGWHPMPYLAQGGAYNEFGNYDVTIKAPEAYVLGASGLLANAVEKIAIDGIVQYKYKADNMQDFVWFASKQYKKFERPIINSNDTVELTGFFLKDHEPIGNEILTAAAGIFERQRKIYGNLPFKNLVIVDEFSSQDEIENNYEVYPGVICLSKSADLNRSIREIETQFVQQYFCAAVGVNRRTHTWLASGLASYKTAVIGSSKFKTPVWLRNRLPYNIDAYVTSILKSRALDQPVNTPADSCTQLNYGLIMSEKTVSWFGGLQSKIGYENMQLALINYYKKWQNKHADPNDFRASVQMVYNGSLDSSFSALGKTDFNKQTKGAKKTKFTWLPTAKEYYKTNYNFINPILGFNNYDKLMLGVLATNYTLQQQKFNYAVAPMFATGSKKINGFLNIGFTKRLNKRHLFTGQLNAAAFTKSSFTDSVGNKTNLGFSKIVPHFKYEIRDKNPRLKTLTAIEFKTFLINEKELEFKLNSTSGQISISYPNVFRYVNQFTITKTDFRRLYPYELQARVDQAKNIVRLTTTNKIYFNYAKGGGMQLRFFAGKIFYTTPKTNTIRFENDRYHLNLTGANGNEDFTYSNYFLGRNDFEGLPSQQIMIRDGAFKVRTDLLADKIGKTDNWLSSVNFTTTIPDNINLLNVLPFKIPLKIFVDVGTTSNAWGVNATGSKFLYDAGLQLSLLKNTVNVYIPLLYSKVYKDYFKSTLTGNRLLQTISFSIDTDHLKLKNIFYNNF